MTSSTPSAAAIRQWSIDYLAENLKVPPARINPNSDFDALGLDSASAIAFVMALEEWLQVELVPELLLEYTTIATLSDHLVTLLASNQKAAV